MASNSKKSKVSAKKASPASSTSKKPASSGKTPVKAAPKPKAPVKAPAKQAPKAAPAKKTAAKPPVKAAKPAPKPAKAPAKAPAKPAPKAAPAKKTAAKPPVKATKPAPKPTPKAPAKAPAKPATKVAPVQKSAAKPPVKADKATAKSAPKTAPKVAAKPAAKAVEAKTPPESKSKGKGVKIELFKGAFFQEVAVGSPAARKNKTPQSTPSAARKPKGEESHDELIARIERELLTVRMTSRKVQREQLCTKCCINPVEPGYMVDRDTGYCLECALVLGLGHTREARQQNFHPSLMKSEDGEEGEVDGGEE